MKACAEVPWQYVALAATGQETTSVRMLRLIRLVRMRKLQRLLGAFEDFMTHQLPVVTVASLRS